MATVIKTTKKTATTKAKTKTATSKTLKPKISRTTKITLNPNGNKLVIVESPGKVKTISKYLGSEYVVKASVGHIVDLVDKNMGKLVEKWFEPDYEVDPKKSKVVSELRSAAKSSSQVILATDEDREWEAISFHLCTVLGLDPKTTPRIVFNEITKPAIHTALENARTIDMDLVSAQKSRAVLDKVVWFSVSPILWTKIRMGLSAGRVQSVAVKLIVEKEREIMAFDPKEFFTLKAVLDTDKWPVEIALKKIESRDDLLGRSNDSEEFEDEDDKKNKGKEWWGKFSKSALMLVLDQLWLNNPKVKVDEKTGYETRTFDKKVTFRLSEITSKQSKKSPPAPFITSSLQQTASRMFGRPVKSVMSAAQKLYEAWLITYMRTDSTNLSWTAIGQCKDFIIWNYGENYHQLRQYASKSKNAQEAHEAIRPTNVSTLPEDVKIGQYEAKLYKLIWWRTVASQMADAIFTNTNYVFYPVI